MRFAASVVVAVLAVTMVGQQPSWAKPGTFAREGAQRFPSIPVTVVKATTPGADLAEAAAKKRPASPVWPVGTAEVDLAAVAASGLQADHEPAASPTVRAGDLPVRVTSVNRSATGRVRVQILPQSAAAGAGISGLLVAVSRTDGSADGLPVSITVDYQAFRQAYGADWASRLRLAHIPACALTSPGAAGCQPRDLLSHNDTSAGTVTAQVAATPANGTSAGLTKAQQAGDAPAMQSMGTVVALTAGPSGGAGNFAATSLSPSSTWSHGGATGGFSWSYPMRTPPAIGGPSPSVSLGYSSQSVDGRSAASNNQPGPIGEGFGYDPGFIERRYKPCADDMTGGNNSVKTGDLCWATDNAFLSLGGAATELIKDPAGNWRPLREDGSKIERLTGAANGDNDGEYWKVTATNGTVYWFGRHQLQGWTAGKPVTNSALTVPVAGNHSGEPCRQTSFASSFCTQAWRWSLDYVQDTFGNTMSLWYTPETNHYAKNKVTSSPVAYNRGGLLSHIDYGTDNRTGFTDTVFTATNVPARVDFGYEDRCLADCWSGSTPNKPNWTDTPWDQDCAASGTCNNTSPTFWSSKRLTTITTSVWKAAETRRQEVDTWTLRQTFPDPGDTTRAGLWLAGITHTGLNGTNRAAPNGVDPISLPEITFTGVQMNNRVDPDLTPDHSPPMNWWRIGSIRTESGAETSITYSPEQCDPDTGAMPAAEDNNAMRCYPVKWVPSGATDPITDYFHKYVVDQVQQIDHTGGAPTVKTFYEYVNPSNLPLWHYDTPDGLVDVNRKTWGQFRGYPSVITKVGEGSTQQKSETLYFRGMHGDKTSTGFRTVDVQGLEGGPAPDLEHYAGMPRETLLYNGSQIISAQVNEPWRSDPPSATRTIDGITVEARYVRNGSVTSRIALDGGAWRRATQTTEHDSYGMPVKVRDLGDNDIAGDESCQVTEYVRDEATVWILDKAKRVRGWAGSCDTPPTTAAQISSDTRFTYDNQPYNPDPNTDRIIQGAITKTEDITDLVGGNPVYTTKTTNTYDVHGRVKETTDIAGEKTTYDYTPATGGPVTKMTTTNPLLWTSYTDLDPGSGTVIKSSDVNGRITEAAYDPLGRTRQVWQPDRPRATKTPNVEYLYAVRNNGPSTVTTKTLRTINGIDAYLTSFELKDSLLRSRQTQSPAVGGGRILTDIFYDSAGRAWKTNAAHYNSSAPTGDTIEPALDLNVPSQTRYQFDAAGRVINTVFYSKDVEQWRSSTVYHGDRVDHLAVQGESATTVHMDVHGQAVKLWQYHGPTATGGYDETLHTYDPLGRLTSVKDASGNTWTHDYDIQGRPTKATDPDTGETTYTYHPTGELKTVTTPAGTVAYTYDRLARPTSVRDNTTDGNLRVSWAYDTPAKGLTKSISRWIGTNEYKTELVTADNAYRPTQVKITIPASEGALQGSYAFRYTYRGDGSPNTVVFPAVTGTGGLNAETLTYEYDTVLGMPKRLATNYGGGITHYVNDAGYTNFGESSFINRSTALTGASMTQSTLHYDEATHRVDRRTVNRSAGDIAYTSYQYDPAGNIKKIDDNPIGGQRDTQCFTYDHHRRLTQAWTPTSADCNQAPTAASLGGPAPYWQSWDFGSPTDPVGRTGSRLKQTDHATPSGDLTTTYSYPAQGEAQPHRLTGTVTKDSGGATVASGTYSYNNLGQVISRPGPTGQQTLGWDKEGHLATVSDTAGNNHSYIYDGTGNRLISKEPGHATLHLGAMDVKLNTSTAAKTVTRYYTFNGEIVAQRTSSAVTFLAGDHHGTAQIAITSDTAQTVTRRRQTPYGEQRGSTGAWVNPKGFVGGHEDATGLTHLGAREYDKKTGRFISIDPVADYGDPQQLHGYAYSNNNPITYSDPSGLIWSDGIGDWLMDLNRDFNDLFDDNNGDGVTSGEELVENGTGCKGGPKGFAGGGPCAGVNASKQVFGIMIELTPAGGAILDFHNCTNNGDLMSCGFMLLSAIPEGDVGSRAIVSKWLKAGANSADVVPMVNALAKGAKGADELAEAAMKTEKAIAKSGEAAKDIQAAIHGGSAKTPAGKPGTGGGGGGGGGGAKPGKGNPPAPDIVYRNIGPGENPGLGLVAKNPDATYMPGGHITHGSRPGWASQFISTTRSLDVAMRWTQGRMVAIDLSKFGGTVIDASTPEARAANGIRGATAARLAQSSREVLLVGFVPPSAISWVLGGPS